MTFQPSTALERMFWLRRRWKRMVAAEKILLLLCIMGTIGLFLLMYSGMGVNDDQQVDGVQGRKNPNEALIHGHNKNPFETEFKGKDRMPPSIENMEEKPQVHTGESLLQYFLTMYTDGIEITWSGEVNSRRKLFDSIKDYMLLMLEADVRVRWIDKTHEAGTAIIGVVQTDSDLEDKTVFDSGLSLAECLTNIAEYSNKGIQLNMPDIETVKISLPVLSSLAVSIHAPVWIHAEILPGPNNDNPAIDPKQLFKSITNYFPDVTLSLSWATYWSPDATQQRYTWQDVISMAKICASLEQRITFPIRAVFALSSSRQLKFLLSLTNRFSVVVWIGKYDIIQLPYLLKFRKIMDHKKVFYNLPPSFMEAIKKVSSEKSARNDDVRWNRQLWQPVLFDDSSLVFLGQDQCALEGAGSWIVSKVPYSPEHETSKVVNIQGKVQFLDDRTKKLSDSNNKAVPSLELLIRSSGVNPPAADNVHGVELSIRSDGVIMLSTRNLVSINHLELKTSAKLPPNDCYSFNIVDKGEDIPVFCEVKIIKCEEDEGNLEPLHAILHLQVPYDHRSFYVVVHPRNTQEAVIVEDLIVST